MSVLLRLRLGFPERPTVSDTELLEPSRIASNLNAVTRRTRESDSDLLPPTVTRTV